MPNADITVSLKISGVLEIEYHPAGRADGDAPVGKLLLVVP
jgi:hypothetical protein